MIRKILILLASLLGMIVIAIAVSVIPVKRYDYKTQEFYQVMMRRLDSIQHVRIIKAKKNFSVGYAVVNLTPQKPTATAGYAPMGKPYESVHDSIYVRTMVITNGSTKVALVSADLLIIPPAVTAVLAAELPEIGFRLNNTYLSATHSHYSLGNWSKGVIGVLWGEYNDTLVHAIADRIKESIMMATQNVKPSSIHMGAMPLRSAVRNRLDKPNGGVDSLLHVLEIRRDDNTKLALLSYTAHATCIDQKAITLSRDYPGRLVDELEEQGYDFAMYMAGAVGSHAANPPESGWGCVKWMADTLDATFLQNRNAFARVKDSTLVMYRVPLALGEAEVKISKDWRLRPWVFRTAFGSYPSYMTVLRIGELVMLGTPCDYSGQLTAPLYMHAQQKGLHAMVTSFNGGYIGYITPIRYYDYEHDETRLFNWYGPGNGEYLQECMMKLIDAVADH